MHFGSFKCTVQARLYPLVSQASRPHVWHAKHGRRQLLFPSCSVNWPLFVLLGMFGAGLSFILYIIGLNHTAPAVASIVAMVEPVTASLFSIVVLNESLVGVQIVGMGLILVTVTALSVFSRAPLAGVASSVSRTGCRT